MRMIISKRHFEWSASVLAANGFGYKSVTIPKSARRSFSFISNPNPNYILSFRPCESVRKDQPSCCSEYDVWIRRGAFHE